MSLRAKKMVAMACELNVQNVNESMISANDHNINVDSINDNNISNCYANSLASGKEK